MAETTFKGAFAQTELQEEDQLHEHLLLISTQIQ